RLLEMYRTVLIVEPVFGSRHHRFRAGYHRSVGFQVLKVSLVDRIVTMFFQPHERLLREVEGSGIARRMEIRGQRINAERISVGGLYFTVSLDFDITLP